MRAVCGLAISSRPRDDKVNMSLRVGVDEIAAMRSGGELGAEIGPVFG